MTQPDTVNGKAVDAVPRLFAALVDDAGLFPPERLPIPVAVARHRADTAAAHPVLTQRFLFPASVLDELRGHLAPDDRWRIGLIVDVPLEQLGDVATTVRRDPRLRLETVELRLPDGEPAASVERALAAINPQDGEATCIELSPAAPGWETALAAIAARGAWAKVRCGGLEAAAFPTAAQLAAFLIGAADLGVPFKATAGLHHAVRYRDPATGFDHHGFLNLLLATARAGEGADAADVETALLIGDAHDLADSVRAVSSASADLARARFRAYGSCSTSEPVEDLTQLGLIGNGEQR
jgi:hypothetical protein